MTAPGTISNEVGLVFGVHWENVFNEQGGLLPAKHRALLVEQSNIQNIPETLQEAYQGVPANVTINMVPGIVSELCSKTGLARAGEFAREDYSETWLSGIFLESFTSMGDFSNFRQACRPDSAWALKPFNSARGVGIRITGCSPKELDKLEQHTARGHHWVAQRYITQPVLTITGHKFDLRTWMLVTSINPLRLYVVKDAHVRIALEKYSNDRASFRNKCAHLTNGSVQKHCHKFSSAVRQQQEQQQEQREKSSNLNKVESIWDNTFAQRIGTVLVPPSPQAGSDSSVNNLWERLEDKMVRTVVSVLPRLRAAMQASNLKGRPFQLLSFDFILDNVTDQEPVLLEVNPDGYLKKGFQMVGGWECTKNLTTFMSEKALPTTQDFNGAERVCRSASRLGLKDAQHVNTAVCRQVVAHHLSETRAYQGTCWQLAFPTRNRIPYLTDHRRTPQQSDSDAFVALAGP